jgi:hypothetical protein
MIAALRAVRARHPTKLIAAAVAPPDTLVRIAAEADEAVCVEAPDFFYAVGQFLRISLRCRMPTWCRSCGKAAPPQRRQLKLAAGRV